MAVWEQGTEQYIEVEWVPQQHTVQVEEEEEEEGERKGGGGRERNRNS